MIAAPFPEECNGELDPTHAPSISEPGHQYFLVLFDSTILCSPKVFFRSSFRSLSCDDGLNNLDMNY